MKYIRMIAYFVVAGLMFQLGRKFEEKALIGELAASYGRVYSAFFQGVIGAIERGDYEIAKEVLYHRDEGIMFETDPAYRAISLQKIEDDTNKLYRKLDRKND